MSTIFYRFTNIASRYQFESPKLRSTFTLDSIGVAGFFGGDTAVRAMATLYLLPFRGWGGWYNSPGSYEIAKRYGQMVDSPLSLTGAGHYRPAELFGLDGKVGPQRYLGVSTGSEHSTTSHLMYLLSRRIQRIPARDFPQAATVPGFTPVYVTVIDLRADDPLSSSAARDPSQRSAVPLPNPHLSYVKFLVIIPTVASVGACVVCALAADWWCFASIALGIVVGGVTSLVVRSGKVVLSHHASPFASRVSDALVWTDNELLVLLGSANAVNVFTRGRLSLHFDHGVRSCNAAIEEHAPSPQAIGNCCALLIAQLLIQLVLIPQGTSFGQLMFAASLVVSWLYHLYLASFDRDELQFNMLMQRLPALAADIAENRIERFRLPSWRTAVVLALLILQEATPIRDPQKIVDELLPNGTPAWQRWKEVVVEQLVVGERRTDEHAADMAAGITFFNDEQQDKLRRWLGDAEIVRKEWRTRKTV